MKFFCGLEKILDYHKILASTLRSRMSSFHPSTTTIGDIFSNFSPELVALYVRYIENFDNVYLLVKYIRKKKPDFKKLIKDFEKKQKETNALDLPSFLILPIQRIPRYLLLLMELVKYTEPSHEDNQKLRDAIDSIRSLLETMDNSKNHANHNQKISVIHRNIDGLDDLELIHPKRRYIREGVLKLEGDEDNPNPYCFLFNDILLYAQHRPNNNSNDGKEKLGGSHVPIPGEREFLYKQAIPLGFCEGVRDNGDNPRALDLIGEEDEIMTFICTDPNEKQLWTASLKAQIDARFIIDLN